MELPASEAAVRFPVVSFRERHNRATRGQPVQFGLPLPKGRCFNHRKLALVDDTGREHPAAVSPTALWPDSSLQWVLLRSRIDLAQDEELRLGLGEREPTVGAFASSTTVCDTGKALEIRLGEQHFVVATDTLGLPDLPGAGFRGSATLSLAGSGTLSATIDTYSYHTALAKDGVQAVDVTLKGHCALPGAGHLNFSMTLHFDGAGERIDGSLTLHNPAAARHPGGLWDLGDANAVCIDSLQLALQHDDASAGGRLQCERDALPRDFHDSVDITQYASGGEHWDSPVHVDQHGVVPHQESGYVLHLDGVKEHGNRADPMLELAAGDWQVSARIMRFWQCFPARLAAAPGELHLGLLPDTGVPHELQPGERVTRHFSLHISRSGDTGESCVDFPELVWALDSEYVGVCDLPEVGDPSAVHPDLQQLINEGVDSEANFFAKREAIDEYGWRHFGDLYADHETDGYTGTRLFVSHYNNQYDPLFGFLRQYLASGDRRWFELADDLARHIVDIDVYNTDEDRPEYNHGLFWHTDHYLPAETATHRAYSHLQPDDAYEEHAHGGGPGGQHCYTSGLLHHYLLTGSEASLEALYALRYWIEAVYEGSGTLTDVPLAIRNRRRRDLKNHLTGQYPQDRGVANYIHALLDCYSLEQRPSTLAQVEWIIRHTIHPADNLTDRELDNVEERWFYVVLLQAVCRYLTLKADRNQLDNSFLYARDALLHYADWMIDNEAPYLNKPEILEFPNHTWTAQDLRKANVLFHASRWAPADREQYAAKAQEFVDHVTGALRNEPTRHYTRILALLMQNAQPSRPLSVRVPSPPPRQRYTAPKPVGTISQLVNLLRLTARTLRRLRPGRDYAEIRRLLAAQRENRSL